MKTRPLLKDLLILILFCILTVFLGHIELELPGKLGINSNFAEVAIIVSLAFINKWQIGIIIPFFTIFNVASDGYFIPETLNHILGFLILFFIFSKIKKIKKTIPYIISWIFTIIFYYFVVLLPIILVYHYLVGNISVTSLVFEYFATSRALFFECLMTIAITVLFHLLYRESINKINAQKEIISINKELEKNVEKLSKIAYIDSKTGLYNGIQLEDDLNKNYNELDKEKYTFIAFRLELNNLYAHEKKMGETFNQFSQAILHFSNTIDEMYLKNPRLKPPAPIKNCYRLQDNIFLCILNTTNISEKQRIHITNSNLALRMENELENCGLNVCFDFQGGIVNYPDDIDKIDEVVMALLKIIHAKRSTSLGYFISFDSKKYINTRLEDELKKLMPIAIENNEFFTVFQPKIDLDQKKVHGYEALGRWNSPDLGFVPPLKFINVAEQNNLIETLTKNQLKDVFNFISKLKEKKIFDFKVSINISPRLLTKDFLTFFIDEILKNKCEHQLEIEITESTLASLNDSTLNIIKSVKKLGVHIAIDDFGTGYSNLFNLQNFEPEVIKIDKSFIDNVPFSEKNNKLVNAILDLAKNLNMNVVAEGIENSEQKCFLEKHGCKIIQGYYYSKPLDFKSAIDFYNINLE